MDAFEQVGLHFLVAVVVELELNDARLHPCDVVGQLHPDAHHPTEGAEQGDDEGDGHGVHGAQFSTEAVGLPALPFVRFLVQF